MTDRTKRIAHQTLRKKAKDALSEAEAAEAKFRRVFESAPDAIVIVNSDGHIIMVNAQTEKLFGYGRDELLAKPVETLVPERFRAAHIEKRNGYISNPTVRRMGSGLELSGLRRDGSEFPVEISLSPQNSLDNYLVLAQKKKISLTSRLDPTIPRIHADPRRLEQVLSNLLSNAIKFTGEGGKIEVGACQENGAGVKVHVKDTGVGIPAQEIGSLFEKYRQTTSARSSNQKGTGLGLAICKMIVETHGGRIWVESEEGKGTTFTFSLPMEL